MAILSTIFINERKDYWERLRIIILKIKRSGYRKLSHEDIKDFPNLYRKTSTDSETAKTLNLSPDTIEYINSLVQQAHNIIYASPPKTLRRFLNFFLDDFPRAFVNNIISIAIIFLIFFGIGTIAFIAVYLHPENAKALVPEYLIAYMKNAYSETPLRSGSENIIMAGFYIANNVTIAFASFVLGISFGLMTIYLIFENALTIGGVLGLVVSSGHGENLFNFIIAHSPFELLGICIAAGAGLAVGISMIVATEEKRKLVIARKAHEVVPLFIVAGIFISMAAFIEGFISASDIPLFIKISIAIISLIFIIIYTNSIFIKRLMHKFFKKRRLYNTRNILVSKKTTFTRRKKA